MNCWFKKLHYKERKKEVMKAQMKKPFALLLVLAMLFTLSACGNTPAEAKPDDQPGASQSAAQPEAPAETKVGWPTKTVEIICPFTAGGDSDTFLRGAADILSREWGVNVIVTNMTGSTESLRYCAAADPDGYTVYYSNSSMLTQFATGKVTDVSYGVDLLAAGTIALDQTYAVVCRANSGFKTINDVAEALKAKPESLKFTIVANSSTQYLLHQMESALGCKWKEIEAGTDNATRLIAVLNGEADFMMGNYSNFKDYIANGDLVCLGIMADERNADFSDVPTLEEQGCPVYMQKYYEFRFPAGTDQAIIDKFSAGLKTVTETQSFIDLTKQWSDVPCYLTAEELDAYDLGEIAKQAEEFQK